MKIRNDVLIAQKKMYEILVAFDKICKKYNLVYWLDHGTLLGAVRHRGFIPWDDDLDVTMPREDYEKFLIVAQKELPNHYFLQTQKTDKYYQNFFAKIRDRKSTLIDEWELKRDIKYHQGIYIDIFPLNSISNNNVLINLYKRFVFISKLFHNRYMKSIYLTKPFVFLLNAFHREDGDFMVSGGENMHYVIHIERENIFPLVEVEFEGSKFPAPRKTDVYLKSIFGDSYMQLPSKDKQKVHSVQILPEIPCRYERENAKK